MRKKIFLAFFMLWNLSNFLCSAEVLLEYYAPFAKSVSVSGDFNNWSRVQNPMLFNTNTGVWRTLLSLPNGQYEYKFIIDEKYWITDPRNMRVNYNNHANSILIVGDTVSKHSLPLEPHPKITHFLKGSDLSFLPEIEDAGGKYIANGDSIDVIKFFKENGQNIVRLRLWHNPEDGYCNLERTLKMARRAKKAGMKVLLDLHYSDTWADPRHQIKPKAWHSLHSAELEAAVYKYTLNVIRKFKEQGVTPYIVQIGNEIDRGFLWPEGKIDVRHPHPRKVSDFIRLLKAAIKGVKDNHSTNEKILIMIHLANSGNDDFCLRFFDMLQKHNVNFDVIGLSYYPWWHGGLENLRINLNNLALRYKKDIVIVETAYPWTLQWNDKKKNIVGTSDKLLPDYPATPLGQKEFIKKIINIVRSVPFSLGRGVIYWAPDAISTPRRQSVWENMTFFDFNGNALPSGKVFR